MAASEMIKTATVEELRILMGSLMNAAENTPDEIDMLYAIVDELKERGEVREFTTDEKRCFAEEAIRRAEETENIIEVNDTSWHDRILQDAAADRRERSLRIRKALMTTASVAVVIFLINTITVRASGVNFIDDFINWTGNAIYSLFGRERDEGVALVESEIQALQDKLDEFGITVALPRSFLKGYTFKAIVVDLEEAPYIVTAWFEQFGSQKEISIKIDGSVVDGLGSMAEVNDWEGLEPIENGGVSYYVYENHDRLKVIWDENSYVMSLQGKFSYKEAKAIIESIKK